MWGGLGGWGDAAVFLWRTYYGEMKLDGIVPGAEVEGVQALRINIFSPLGIRQKSRILLSIFVVFQAVSFIYF